MASADMAGIHITDIEAAINWWRERKPSPDGITACPEVRALAEVYALMVYYHEAECDEDSMPVKAKDAWLAWYDTTPDTPCIAICSTSQGDDTCKGCGRDFDEVQDWPALTPAEKRAAWRRISMEGTAWRFNRYAERAREATALPGQPRPSEATAQAGADTTTPEPGQACAATPASAPTRASSATPTSAPALTPQRPDGPSDLQPPGPAPGPASGSSR